MGSGFVPRLRPLALLSDSTIIVVDNLVDMAAGQKSVESQWLRVLLRPAVPESPLCH